MRAINKIVVHCSATSAQAKTSDIKSYWAHVLGWKKFGYHWLIGEDGEKERLTDDEHPSNGVSGHNHDSIHICYKGGKDGVDTRTHAQKKAILSLLISYRKKYPNAKILGHRDLYGDTNGDGRIDHKDWLKTCPAFDVRKEFGYI